MSMMGSAPSSPFPTPLLFYCQGYLCPRHHLSSLRHRVPPCSPCGGRLPGSMRLQVLGSVKLELYPQNAGHGAAGVCRFGWWLGSFLAERGWGPWAGGALSVRAAGHPSVVTSLGCVPVSHRPHGETRQKLAGKNSASSETERGSFYVSCTTAKLWLPTRKGRQRICPAPS